jgi:hypothetical protein
MRAKMWGGNHSDYRTVSPYLKTMRVDDKMVTHGKIVDPLYILHENMPL